MYVRDHMTENPVTVRAETSVSKALDLMNENHFRYLPVTDQDEKLTGILSRDLIHEFMLKKQSGMDRFQMYRFLSATRTKDIMIKDPKAVLQDAPLDEAAEMIRNMEVHALPVIDEEGRVKGIITQGDILKALVQKAG